MTEYTAPTPEDLERAFRKVRDERMKDIPILNPALEVAAIGFREWQGHQVGVLLTPWFMNLILLPPDADAWPDEVIGDSRSFVFPSGSYDFLLGEQDGIGRYRCCSLFSPVFEFSDQTVAVATAEAIMAELFEGECESVESTETKVPVCDEPPEDESRREFLRGEFTQQL